MGQILHKCARTTEVIRKEIRSSEESINFLAKKYNISPTTVQKWKQRKSSSDSQMGNGRANSVLTPHDVGCYLCSAA